VNRDSHRVYRPISPQSAFGRVLCVAAVLAVARKKEFPNALENSTWKKAEEFVEQRWGVDPDLELRFRDRQYVFSSTFAIWALLVVPGAFLYGAGLTVGVQILEVSGAALIIMASVPMGVLLGTFARTASIVFDNYRWIAAGKPHHWELSARSQYRDTDLVWCFLGGLVAALIAWKMLFP
jgi:hypothetical protein